VRDIWTIGPTATAICLQRQGFTPRQAERLVALERRLTRTELDELTYEECRLRFVRWLVELGRFTDWPTASGDTEGTTR
jgi:hypothetical protein